MRVRHEVDGDPLLQDSLLYVSDAGYPFQVGRLRYFLYDFSLVTAENFLEPVGGFQLVDSWYAFAQDFQIGEVPKGEYIGIEFHLGLNAIADRQGGLATTSGYDEMSGAPTAYGYYHYLKFDGLYLFDDTLRDYKLYLAGADARIRYRILRNFSVGAGGRRLELVMNLGEWLRNPEDYDFLADGPNSLDNPSSMIKLASNGTDVFRLE
ncbi:MAG: MbnP family protein [Bacteroidota bacterium]